jgi:hypothetical protein
VSQGGHNREERDPDAEPDERDSFLDSARAVGQRVGGLLGNLSGRQQLSICGAAVLIALLVKLALPHIPGSEHVELDLKAGQGTTTFSLASELEAVSPGCGCPHPEWGKHRWEGMSVPSRAFHLDVESQPSEETDPGLWSLTAMSPNTGAINWYGEPNRALWMDVQAHESDGQWKTLFYGGASYFMLWTADPLRVRQSRQYPYAAVLPAAGGSTTFTSHEPSRNQWANFVDISTTAPARAFADPDDAGLDEEVSQRGPMLDLLGPEVTLSTPYSKQLQLWAGQKEITRARPGQSVKIEIYTPFAVRLIPHPVQVGWRAEVAEATNGGLLNPLGGQPSDFDTTPRGRGRIQLTGALPSYTVLMRHVQPPGASWSSFAARSASRELVSEMMGSTSLDPLPSEVWHSSYGLPPVTIRPQIGIFGRITNFRSTSVGGTAVIGSNDRAIPRGEELRFRSSDGLEAGQYRFTPLVSSGQETAETSIFGVATIFVGGSLASHPEWMPVGLIGAGATAILGILLSIGLNRWFGRKDEPDAR